MRGGGQVGKDKVRRGDEWGTPRELLKFFDGWDDPAMPGRTDGLMREWGDPTYCNPPYSNPLPWVRKAIEEARKGKRIVMLLRHDSSTEWWRLLHEARSLFCAVIGRLHFSGQGPANFASVLVFVGEKAVKV